MCLQHRPDTARAPTAAGEPVGAFPSRPRRASQPRSCRLRPIRARVRHQRARLGRSERYGETDSGAVSAGSNPAGGTAQRHKFEHSANLEPVQRRAVTCGNANTFWRYGPRPLLLSLRATHAGRRTSPQMNTGRRTVHARNPSPMFTMTLARTAAGPDRALTCLPRNWCPVTDGYSPTAARPAISGRSAWLRDRVRVDR